MLVPSLFAVAALVLVHVFAHRLKFLEGTPRSIWLSAAGGISLAYVFLHLLPELAEGQALLAAEGMGLGLVEFEIYGLALVGLLAFYGVERMVQVHEELGRTDMDERIAEGHAAADVNDPHEHPSFWLHLTTFTIYNVIIGYLLLHRGSDEGHDGMGHGGAGAEHVSEAPAHTVAGGAGDGSSSDAGGLGEGSIDGAGLAEGGAAISEAPAITAGEGDVAVLLTFAVAMALHFLVTDYGLREDFRHGWMRTGRWVLSGAVMIGWALGATIALPEIAILGAIALLGGGVILNVLKEELPEERQSRFGALLAGAGAYTALLAFAH